jgi:hypothetical protein
MVRRTLPSAAAVSAAPGAPLHAALEALGRGAIVVRWLPAADLPAARAAARERSTQLQHAAQQRWPGRRLYVSRSATAGLAAVACSLHAPVGIDVERPGDAPDAALLGQVLHATEQALAPLGAAGFSALWARKEAVLKALGTGLALPPHRVACGGRCADWRRIDSPWGGAAWLRSIDAPGGLAAAVASLEAGAVPWVVEVAPSRPGSAAA